MSTSTAERVLEITHTRNFTVNGRGDNPAWNNVEPVPLHSIQPMAHPEKYATWFKALWSDKGVYFLIDCTDPKISATHLPDMGPLYTQDVAEVFIWTDETHPLYFEYEISPFGSELVLLVANMDMTYMGWLPFLYEGQRRVQKAVHVRGGAAAPGGAITGWSAEFFIPTTILKPLQNATPAPGVTWRVNVYRIDYDHRPHHHFEYHNVGPNFHNFRKFPKLKFV